MTDPRPQVRRTRIPRRPRPLLRAAAALVVIGVLAVAWIGIRAYLAKGHLERARTALTVARAALTSGDPGAAQAAIARASAETRRARGETSDPLWHLASHLPVVGSTLHTASAVAQAADLVARQALPPLVQTATQISGPGLRTSTGAIDLTHVDAAATALDAAAPIVRHARLVAEGVPASRLASVNSARTTLTAELARIERQLVLAGQAADISRLMLAPTGTRRYLVVLQNPAESRGTGGLPGTYALISVTHGLIKLDAAGPDSDLIDRGPAVDISGRLDPAFIARWGSYGPGTDWRETNLSPDFPSSAKALATFFQAKGNPAVDGVIAIDPATAGYLVDATGPVRLSDGSTLTGGEVPAYVMSTSYARFGTDSTARKASLVDLVKQAFTRVAQGGGDPTALLRALGRGASEGRIRVWSTRADEQARLTGTVVGGVLSSAPGPFAGLTVNNGAGNKMDYYLETSLSYEASGCAGATRDSAITATLRNTGPASGLPAIVSGFEGSSGMGIPRGTNRALVSIYAAVGARVSSVTVDGNPATLVTTIEKDHTVVTGYLDVAPGATRVVVVRLSEPADGTPGLLPTVPMAHLTQVDYHAQSCLADPFTVVTPLPDH